MTGGGSVTRVFRNEAGAFVNIGPVLHDTDYSDAAWGDYDNDGDLDIFLAGKLGPPVPIPSLPQPTRVYRNDAGVFVDITAPLRPCFKPDMAWGDYDNDGDLDILLTGQDELLDLPFSKVYRNDGGSFVDIAAALVAGREGTMDWGDCDNDGDLDILLTGESPTGPITKVFINENGNFVDLDAGLIGVYRGSANWGDYDNDGDLDIVLTGYTGSSYIAKIYRNDFGASNSRPQAPNGLRAEINGNAVTLSWDKAADNETLQNGLTYNLRVGKTPGGGEVMSPMSAVNSGTRYVVQLGNVNHNTSWTLKNLPPGTYYWSVQAIDNAFAGSAFTPEQSFVVGLIVWPGDANNDKLVNQADVLPVGLHWNKTGPARQNASTDWTAQSAMPWTPEAAAYADGNGDGTVNQADILPIGLNWGKTHSATSLVAGNADGAVGLGKVNAATLSMAIVGDTNPGQEFWLEVRAADVADLFGIAFELLYSPTTFVEAQTAEAGSMLGNDVIFFPKIDKANGKVSIGLTRKSGQSGVTGADMMVRIKMKMASSATIGAKTDLILQNAAANDPAGQPIQLNVVGQPLVTQVTSGSETDVPTVFALHANLPNPFNPSTMIKYDLAALGEVTVIIFDILGKPVRTLVSERQPAGRYTAKWDGRDSDGQLVVSGVFIYQLRLADSATGGAGIFVQNRKMLLLQ